MCHGRVSMDFPSLRRLPLSPLLPEALPTLLVSCTFSSWRFSFLGRKWSELHCSNLRNPSSISTSRATLRCHACQSPCQAVPMTTDSPPHHAPHSHRVSWSFLLPAAPSHYPCPPKRAQRMPMQSCRIAPRTVGAGGTCGENRYHLEVSPLPTGKPHRNGQTS